jgi:hypothetical protein
VSAIASTRRNFSIASSSSIASTPETPRERAASSSFPRMFPSCPLTVRPSYQPSIGALSPRYTLRCYLLGVTVINFGGCWGGPTNCGHYDEVID